MDHCGVAETPAPSSARTRTFCLAGMPNSGKTTLMNALTGGSFRTGNYPGVTVGLLQGRSKAEFGEPDVIIDLPGVHSRYATSPEEELSAEVIDGRHASVRPDVFVAVVDATQIERHLKFAGFIARRKHPLVIALTMNDLLPRVKQAVDARKLEAALGVPVIEVDGRTGRGARELLAAAREAGARGYCENALARLSDDAVAAFLGVRALVQTSGAVTQFDPAGRAVDPVTERIDRIVLHRYLGVPIFFLILAGLFTAIFWAARPLMDGIDAGFGALSDLVLRIPNGGVFARFLGEGLIRGVGMVVVFFPQVLILFFLMTLLEDSGYLARGAALMDRPLRRVGLHGRSFVPMLSGFACAIPATLAARAIPTKRERLLTIWILPLMSCNARLPVYALLLAALLPRDTPWRAGLVLSAIYIGSLVIGTIVAGLLGRFLRRESAPSLLAMELPLYRRPQLLPILKMTWARSSSYLRRAGGPIAMVAALLWLLSNFGFGHASAPTAQAPATPAPLVAQRPLDQSFAAQIGRWMEPALRPMGVDWRVGVGLLSAFAAREVFISSLAVVFHVAGDEDSQQEGLLEQMRQARSETTGRPLFTTATILGLIFFFFFSLQCVSTVAVVRKETNSLRFPGAQLLFYTTLGYLAAVGIVQGSRLLGG